MKKIISLFMCIVLVLSVFVGCSKDNDVNNEKTDSGKTNNGFVKIEEQLGLDESEWFCLDIRDNIVVMLTQKTVFSDEDKGSDYDESTIERVDYLLTSYDLEKKKLVNEKNIELDKEANVSKIEYQEDNKIVVKTYTGKAFCYDNDFNEISQEKYDSSEDRGDFIDDSKFEKDINLIAKGVGMLSGFNFSGYLFKDEPNTAYLLDKPLDRRSSVCGCFDKRVMTYGCDFVEIKNEKDSDDNERINSVTFEIKDYKSKQKLAETKLDYANKDVANIITQSAMNEHSAFIVLTTVRRGADEDIFDTSCYYWDYEEESAPSPIDSEAYSYDDFWKKCDKTKEELSEENDIFVDYNIDSLPYRNDEEYEEGDYFYIDYKIENPVKVYDSLLECKKILANFPKGMVSKLDNFRLYLVNSIDGVGAYASDTIGDPDEKPLYFVVLSMNGVNSLPHELMHSFESYVKNNFEDNAFSTQYDKLNVDDFYSEMYSFEHDGEGLEEYVYNPDTLDKSCFVTEYATTNTLEDKAELFQMLYKLGADKERYGDEEAEKLNAPVIRKKAQMIIDTLRKYFPEIKEETVWEKGFREATQ